MPRRTVFYSWQSDLPNATNRGFIEDCLRRALKDLQASPEIDLDPAPDRDTKGVPGAPNIADTILEKIDNASVFVADVSLIQPPSGDGSRRTPNPNVLVELGWAARALGWDRVVLVLNDATGAVEDLPFDIRQRRIVRYRLTEGEEKSKARDRLVASLKAAIVDILAAPDKAERAARERFISSLAPVLNTVLMLADEYDDRQVHPGLGELLSEYEMAAREARDLASDDVATKGTLARDLDELARLLDAVANFQLAMGKGDELRAAVEAVATKARTLKADHIDALPLSKDSMRNARARLLEIDRKLQSLVTRSTQLADEGRVDEVKDEAARLGNDILSLAYFDLDGLGGGLGPKLREIGHPLHVVRSAYPDNWAYDALVLEQIAKAASALSEAVSSLRDPGDKS